MFTNPARSLIARAIRHGPTFAEENIVLSLNAHSVIRNEGVLEKCINGASLHPALAAQIRHGIASVVGSLETHTTASLDESVTTVGGGVVILKMIDLSTTSEQLAITLGLLRDMIKDSWIASEEMERIRKLLMRLFLIFALSFRRFRAAGGDPASKDVDCHGRRMHKDHPFDSGHQHG